MSTSTRTTTSPIGPLRVGLLDELLRACETLKACGRSVPVDPSSVDAVDRALCRARVWAEAGAAYVEQQEVDGTQLVHGEVAELFNAVADAARDARRQLRDCSQASMSAPG